MVDLSAKREEKRKFEEVVQASITEMDEERAGYIERLAKVLRMSDCVISIGLVGGGIRFFVIHGDPSRSTLMGHLYDALCAVQHGFAADED